MARKEAKPEKASEEAKKALSEEEAKDLVGGVHGLSDRQLRARAAAALMGR